LTRSIDGGRYAAVISIRSGTGSMTHDRVLRFVPEFDTPDQATRFATEQALAWIARPEPRGLDTRQAPAHERRRPAPPPPRQPPPPATADPHQPQLGHHPTASSKDRPHDN